MRDITIFINRGPAGPVDTVLRDLLTTDDRSGVRLILNSDGGYELGLWNEDLGDYVVLTATGTGEAMTTTFIENP
ncbi:MAG: hypothetical protein EOP83_27150 [Verrucomicrobiaceae bacterium]|nr:MAG: hypothetical protein EOP83_27150 [Verrucomicrobiaceae bacterium]